MLTVPAHVHWARCGDGTAVLNLCTGQWRMFTDLGARIWDAITLRGGTEGLAEEIAIPAGYDPGATRDAVDTYVLSLVDMGLLTDANNKPRKGRWR